jgi:hypothetical protein
VEHSESLRRREGRAESAGQFGQASAIESGAELADAASLGEREPHNATRAESRERARQDAGGESSSLADSRGARFEGRERARAHEPGTSTLGSVSECRDLWPARPGEPQQEWEAPRTVEPGLGRTVNGNSDGLDELLHNKDLNYEILPDMQTADSNKGQKPSEVLRTKLLCSGPYEIQPEQRDSTQKSTASIQDNASLREMRQHTERSTPSSGHNETARDSISLPEMPHVRRPTTGQVGSVRVDRLRLCGNGVVPATAELAYRTLSERLKRK